MQRGSPVNLLLRFSWPLVLIAGLLASAGIYRHLQDFTDQQVSNAIALRSQVKLDAIRSILQQREGMSQTIIAFMQGEMQAHSYIEEGEASGFIRALLDQYKGELDTISLLPSPEMGKPLTMGQNDATVSAPLPAIAQLAQMPPDSRRWQVEQIADHPLLRITIATGQAIHRAYVISDWNIQALIAAAIASTPSAGLDISIDVLSDNQSHHLFSHSSRLSNKQLTGLKNLAWQGTFNIYGASFVVHTQAAPELLRQFSSNYAIWMLLLGLSSTALLALILFNIARADKQIQKDVAERTRELSGERQKLAAVIDHADDGILISNAQGGILRANPAANEMFGYSEQDWHGLTIHDLLPDLNSHADWFTTQTSDHGFTGETREVMGQRSNGLQFPCEIVVHTFEAEGESRCSLTLRDMTERKRREWVQSALLKLRATSQASAPLHTRLKQMLEDMLMDPWHASNRAGAIFIARKEQQWLAASFGWSVAEKRQCITLPVNQCVCGNAPGSCASIKGDMHAEACAARLCMPLMHNDRPIGLLHLQLQPGKPAAEEYLRFCRQARDVINELLLREHVRQALQESENKHRQLVENTPLGIVIYTDGKVCYTNPAAVTMLGAHNTDEILGLTVLDFIVEEDRDSVSTQLHTLQQGGYVQALEERFRRLDGTSFWGEMRGVPIEYQSRPAVQLLIQDISIRKQAQEQLKVLSYSDELTGLPNRRHYTDRVEQTCSLARRGQQPFSLLFIDLDRFKVINDTRGHACGDQVLKVVAERLLATLRISDTAARMGGDEFAVLLPETKPDKALRVAGKLIAALKQPILLGDQEISIGASIGLAAFPGDGEDVSTLLKHADSAMYYAKQNHMDIHCFSSAMEAVARRRIELEHKLAVAADLGQLSLYYQSQHALPADGTETTITGVESLMRWHHPELGMISPAEFIPLAEETGLIASITAWAIAAASRQALVWEKAGIRPNRISVNISAAQLMQPDLAREILSLIRDNGAKPQWIEIEITETAAMNQPETGIAIMRELVAGGVSIAIDDFGTGYSSLAYLKRLPADHLKIDIAFIRNLPDDVEDTVIVRTIIAMAHALGLTVIAEGVETEAQLALLHHEGCDRIQGYLLGKPLPADEATAMLRTARLA